MKNTATTSSRSLSTIAREINADWRTMPEYARAHFRAFQYANSITEMFGCDSVKGEVLYFLGNASTWRGETAKRIKAELKAMAGIK